MPLNAINDAMKLFENEKITLDSVGKNIAYISIDDYNKWLSDDEKLSHFMANIIFNLTEVKGIYAVYFRYNYHGKFMKQLMSRSDINPQIIICNNPKILH